MFDFLAVFLRCREAARLLQTTSENSSSAALRQRVTINSREGERVAFVTERQRYSVNKILQSRWPSDVLGYIGGGVHKVHCCFLPRSDHQLERLLQLANFSVKVSVSDIERRFARVRLRTGEVDRVGGVEINEFGRSRTRKVEYGRRKAQRIARGRAPPHWVEHQ